MKEILKNRTKQFALSIIELIEGLPNNKPAKVVSNQLLQSATSVGANYRSACRSRSDNEFIHNINSVLEEADKCCYWLEIIDEKNWVSLENLAPLMVEADELTAIFVKSLKTINRRVELNTAPSNWRNF